MKADHRLSAAGVLVAATVLLCGCKQENKFVPPPPAKVPVATPLQKPIRSYLEATGNTEAYNSVDLVARVAGFLTSIDYQDGAAAKHGDILFVIEPTPYQAQFQQAQASLASAQAQLVKSQQDYERQQTLFRQDVTAAKTLDTARAQRDSDQAAVTNAQAGLTIAAVNLGYTNVTAPFDGVVSRHLVSQGSLVGKSETTKLATITQLDPIYVSFSISEQDALKIRQNLGGHRMTLAELQKVPVEIGLMDETGTPHRGHLDYVSPTLDAATGTLLVRGVFDNADRALVPGFFTRVRIPAERGAQTALLVPDRIIGTSQAGRYVLVVNKDNVVEQRLVTLGQLEGSLREIESGLVADDRVLVSSTGAVPPGAKIEPQPGVIADDPPAAP